MTLSLFLSVTLASIILSTEGRVIDNEIPRSRRDAMPYLASRLMGLSQDFGSNLPDSDLYARISDQIGFLSGSSQLNNNGAVSPSFPTAPHEGVNLVNNGTGLNIAYESILSLPFTAFTSPQFLFCK